jgi:hypothetical protein
VVRTGCRRLQLASRHGADPESFMTHIALWEAPAPDSGEHESTWGEHVTDEEYGAGR